VAAILPLGERGFLLRYGNAGGVDVDLFAAVGGEESLLWNLGRVDLLVLGLARTRQWVRVFDPIVTEPLRTGHIVAGDEDSFRALQHDFERATPSDEAVRSLSRRAIEEALRATTWLERYAGSSRPGDRRACLDSLSYSCTYAAAAEAVSVGRIPQTLSELVATDGFLRNVRLARRETTDGIAAMVAAWHRKLALGVASRRE
jgi:hypothetical protein